jgi:hypothetical protein
MAGSGSSAAWNAWSQGWTDHENKNDWLLDYHRTSLIVSAGD